ncbi:MAG: DciA family protein [Gammaproteobacteria bacterium]
MSTGRPRKTRKISDLLLGSKGVPANLYHHSLDLMVVQESIRRTLGPPLDKHFYLSSFNHGTILVYTDSPVWATKLRFKAATILEIARTIPGLEHLKTARIRVNPALTSRPGHGHEPPPLMSPASARLLGKVAENLDNSSKLRNSLLRLSQNKTIES